MPDSNYDRSTCARLFGTPLQEVTCGQPTMHTQTVVANGEIAQPHAWPWQMALLKQNRRVASVLNHHCGASIIGREHAVTAAHCNPTVGGRVVAGMHTYPHCTPPSCQIVTIIQIWIHPNYINNPAGRVRNDVALLKFSPPLDFGNTIHPVCLPEPFQHPPAGTQCVFTGWGNLGYSRFANTPQQLQQAQAPLLEDSQCKESYGQSPDGWAFIPSQMTCVGDLNAGGASICNGDSGGPLVCKIPGKCTTDIKIFFSTQPIPSSVEILLSFHQMTIGFCTR